MWKLWLDDDSFNAEMPNRNPPIEFIAAASSEEAKSLVMEMGMPTVMDLDHDLGGNDTAMNFLHWLYNENIVDVEVIPEPPIWKIHSMNYGGGRDNIASFMMTWEKMAGSKVIR